MTEGHNSNAQLKSIIERIVTLEEGKREASDDIKDILSEAKSNGYDAAAIRAIVKEKLADNAKRRKQSELAETIEAYRAALGDFLQSPLGRAAATRAGLMPPV